MRKQVEKHTRKWRFDFSGSCGAFGPLNHNFPSSPLLSSTSKNKSLIHQQSLNYNRILVSTFKLHERKNGNETGMCSTAPRLVNAAHCLSLLMLVVGILVSIPVNPRNTHWSGHQSITGRAHTHTHSCTQAHTHRSRTLCGEIFHI